MNAKKLSAALVSIVALTSVSGCVTMIKSGHQHNIGTERITYRELKEYRITCERPSQQYEFLKSQYVPRRIDIRSSDKQTRLTMESGIYNALVRDKMRDAESMARYVASVGLAHCLKNDRNQW